MKTLILSTILLLPCLAVLNESESLFPNLFGLAYILILFALSRTSWSGGGYYCKEVEKNGVRIYGMN